MASLHVKRQKGGRDATNGYVILDGRDLQLLQKTRDSFRMLDAVRGASPFRLMPHLDPLRSSKGVRLQSPDPFLWQRGARQAAFCWRFRCDCRVIRLTGATKRDGYQQ